MYVIRKDTNKQGAIKAYKRILFVISQTLSTKKDAVTHSNFLSCLPVVIEIP